MDNDNKEFNENEEINEKINESDFVNTDNDNTYNEETNDEFDLEVDSNEEIVSKSNTSRNKILAVVIICLVIIFIGLFGYSKIKSSLDNNATNTDNNNSSSNNNTNSSTIEDINIIKEGYYLDSNFNTVTVKNISDDKILFDLSIYRLVLFEDCDASISNQSIDYVCNYEDDKISGTITYTDNKLLLAIDKLQGDKIKNLVGEPTTLKLDEYMDKEEYEKFISESNKENKYDEEIEEEVYKD